MDMAAARLRGHEPKPAGTNQTIEQAGSLFSSKATAWRLTTEFPCQKGQKGQKGAQRHHKVPLSDLSDLSGGGALEKSSGLTCQRWMWRPPVLVVTSFSQPAPTNPSSSVRACMASSRRT